MSEIVERVASTIMNGVHDQAIGAVTWDDIARAVIEAIEAAGYRIVAPGEYASS